MIEAEGNASAHTAELQVEGGKQEEEEAATVRSGPKTVSESKKWHRAMCVCRPSTT